MFQVSCISQLAQMFFKHIFTMKVRIGNTPGSCEGAEGTEQLTFMDGDACASRHVSLRKGGIIE